MTEDCSQRPEKWQRTTSQFSQKLLCFPSIPKLITFPIWDDLFNPKTGGLALAARLAARRLPMPIPGHENYLANSYGTIYSSHSGRELKPNKAAGGRPRVELSGYVRPISARRTQQFYVARLVLLTCHGPAPCHDCPIVHIDGNNSNNDALNLEWGLSAFLKRYFKSAYDIREVCPFHYVDRFGNGWKMHRGMLKEHNFGGRLFLAKIIAKKFLGTKPKGFVLSYKDGNSSNLSAENLAWRPRRKMGEGFGYFKLAREQQQLATALENYDDTSSGNNDAKSKDSCLTGDLGRVTVRVNDYFS